MLLNFFNSESREKEPFLLEKKVKLYTCGPTIYDFAHIGNFRTYVFEDLLRRTLKFFGHDVEQTMNITDVDDKTIRGATQKKVSLKEYTEPFRKAFFEDLENLFIERVEHYLDATDSIPEMIRIIQTLLDKGYAYRSVQGSIYFKISQFSSYGRLAHLQLDRSESCCSFSHQDEADEYGKEKISDFVLWKAYDPSRDGTIFWESPFGPGRPGWHIECSAMAMKSLGETIDIHCGGIDNLFPHHENEIAQSECATGKRFVRYWMHAEHLLVNHQKMSKSLGNFYTLRDLLEKGYTGKEIRYLLLSTHYRTQLNFTFQGLDAARASLERLSAFITRLKEIDHQEKIDTIETLLHQKDLEFRKALSDDLNISVALAALFDLVREINHLCDLQKVGQQGALLILQQLRSWDRVLSLLPWEEKKLSLSEECELLLQEREVARKRKDFARSDQLRKEIEEKGFLIEDTLNGVRLKKRGSS